MSSVIRIEAEDGTAAELRAPDQGRDGVEVVVSAAGSSLCTATYAVGNVFSGGAPLFTLAVSPEGSAAVPPAANALGGSLLAVPAGDVIVVAPDSSLVLI